MYADARDQGYRLTMPATAELGGPHLADIGVERIDHGVNCLEDEALAEISAGGWDSLCGRLRDRRHQGRGHQVHRGMRVTLNSDDPAYFPGYTNFMRVPTRSGSGEALGSVET